MSDKTTDAAWERYGSEDPYFGVLTHEKFRRDRLTEANKEEFFATAVYHVAEMLETIRRHIDPEFRVGRALDFGCGVGRIVIPLAAYASEVTGVDVSDSMLKEARRNCDARQLRNVELVKSDDELSLLKGPYDIAHSFIVFQHIPVPRGEILFRRIVELLAPGGVGVLHLTYAKGQAPGWRGVVKDRVPLAREILARRRQRLGLPAEMQMNPYDLNRLFTILQAARITELHVEFTDHGDRRVVLYFRKPPPSGAAAS